MNIEIIEITRSPKLTIAYYSYTLDGRDFESNINFTDENISQSEIMTAIKAKLEENVWL